MSELVSVLNRATTVDGHSIFIGECGPVGQVSLRGDLSSKALIKAIKTTIGVGVPGPLRVEFEGENGAVWMSPDELLLFTEYDLADALVETLTKALAGEHHMAVNVSDARVVISLTGPDVAEVLAKGAPVDLSETTFPVGTARRTHIGGIAVGFWRNGDQDWQIVCLRSFARHLYDWLIASSRTGSEVEYL